MYLRRGISHFSLHDFDKKIIVTVTKNNKEKYFKTITLWVFPLKTFNNFPF